MAENTGITKPAHCQYHAAVVRRGTRSLPNLWRISWLLDNMSFWGMDRFARLTLEGIAFEQQAGNVNLSPWILQTPVICDIDIWLRSTLGIEYRLNPHISK